MKKKFILCIALLSVIIAFSEVGLAKMSVPGRTGSWVNDYAGIIDAKTKDYLERLISSMPQKTPDPVEIIVTTFDDLGGWTMEDLARVYGEQWRRTKKGRDNGVVILVFKRQGQMPIGVGKNLKGILTKKILSDMMTTTIIPIANKEGYSAAVKKAAETIIDVLNKSQIPQDQSNIVQKLIIMSVVIAFIGMWAALKKGNKH